MFSHQAMFDGVGRQTFPVCPAIEEHRWAIS